MRIIAVRISYSNLPILIFNKMFGAQRLGLFSPSFFGFSFRRMDATSSLVPLYFIFPEIILVISFYIFWH